MTLDAFQAPSTSARPLIPVRNVWYLLLYAWDMARWKGNSRRESEPAPKLLGLIASILAESTHELLRRQLRRAHSRRYDTIKGVRGRIDFATSLKRLTFRNASAHCQFSELNVDTLKNRILLATLDRLSSSGDFGLAYQREQEDSLRQELRGLIRELKDVSLVPISSSDFNRLQLGRNDRDYALPMALCQLVHRLEMPTESEGDQVLSELLRDEITFHDLFERFVRNFYHLRLHDYSVGRERLQWHDELRCKFVPSMKTDITIVEKRPPFRVIIIDTKYSIRTLVETSQGIERFKSTNLYQIYTYLRTQEHSSEARRYAEGILLYPTTEREIDESMKVQGHRIRIATVNLAQEWESIEGRLLKLVH